MRIIGFHDRCLDGLLNCIAEETCSDGENQRLLDGQLIEQRVLLGRFGLLGQVERHLDVGQADGTLVAVRDRVRSAVLVIFIVLFTFVAEDQIEESILGLRGVAQFTGLSRGMFSSQTSHQYQQENLPSIKQSVKVDECQSETFTFMMSGALELRGGAVQRKATLDE